MAENLKFSVNIESPIAVYVQIENQVQFAIASGRIKPGEMLPPALKMSSMLNINPNTVTKAYRDLEIMKLVHASKGVGVTIAEKAAKISRETTLAMVKSHLIDAVAECMAAGLSAADVQKIVAGAIDAKTAPYLAAKKK